MKTILVDAVHALVSETGIVSQELFTLLETYKEEKIVLTNASSEEQIRFGLDKIPYKVFTLSHSPNKTDPEYYALMLQNLQLTPENCIYFEHDKVALENALKVGIPSMLFAGDIQAIQTFLDTNLKMRIL